MTPADAKPTGGTCPICGKPAVHAVRPFCSARCADIDLARWVSGAYVIAGGQADADEDGDEGFAREAGQLDRGKGAPDGETQ
ncbi:DNA gyrase inhibitor YacG [uncultured Hyphomicrobium sp.]|uniref:DNA gyrase inhibitor YacG n=1 Tax=uncultured Hyphomicrobium sp. TaxID=194373 RepID=UPI002600BD93|nr:DNA gyrase inhibitor YacG [uncultured Hyphomicrobium sp.]